MAYDTSGKDTTASPAPGGDLPSIGRAVDVLLRLLVALSVLLAPVALEAQTRGALEEEAERARRGAGLRIGGWLTSGLAEVDGVDYSTTPHFEGWYQRGLDRHIAIESTLSVWRREQERQDERATTYIVPLFTSVKFFPGVGPEDQVQPYLLGGGGVALGIDDRENTSGGLLGLGGGGGTSFATGFGLRGGAGLDLWLGRSLGVTLGGRYQWLRFFDGNPGGERTYQGTVVDLGVTYRFQY
jgi:opacity protein-like surface antigen